MKRIRSASGGGRLKTCPVQVAIAGQLDAIHDMTLERGDFGARRLVTAFQGRILKPKKKG